MMAKNALIQAHQEIKKKQLSFAVIFVFFFKSAAMDLGAFA